MPVRLCQVWDSPSIPYWKFGLTPLKVSTICQIIWIWSSFVLFSTSYLTTSIVDIIVLLLVLIILVRSCINFLLIWSIHILWILPLIPSYASFFEWLLGRQRKVIMKEISTVYFNSPISYVSFFTPSPLYMTSSKERK